MDIKLTPQQQEYVDAYNIILNKLANVQERIASLEEEASVSIEELKQLRLKERDAFPEQ